MRTVSSHTLRPTLPEPRVRTRVEDILESSDEMTEAPSTKDVMSADEDGVGEEELHSLQALHINRGTLLQGYLRKLSPSTLKGWQRRWFTVRPFTLSWTEERSNEHTDDADAVARRHVDLNDVVAVREVDAAKDFVFEVATEQRTYIFAAYTLAEYETWMNGLRQVWRALRVPAPYDYAGCMHMQRRAPVSTPYVVVRNTLVLACPHSLDSCMCQGAAPHASLSSARQRRDTCLSLFGPPRRHRSAPR